MFCGRHVIAEKKSECKFLSSALGRSNSSKICFHLVNNIHEASLVMHYQPTTTGLRR
jgi:hypothetical protein